MVTRTELVKIMRDELKARGYPIETQAAILGQFKKEMQFAPKYATQPEARSEKSANEIYANKNGNTEKGDGYKYRGRSYIQLTGKSNYKKVGEELFLDGVIDDPDALVTNPDLLLDPVLGAKASIAYLNIQPGFKNVIEKPDVKKQSIALTKLINPGLFKKQKDFYLPENTKKNVILDEGSDLRHKDNQGNRTGITYKEDVNLRFKYADDFRKQLLVEQAGIPITVDGDFGGKSKDAWELLKKTPTPKTSDQQIPYSVTPTEVDARAQFAQQDPRRIDLNPEPQYATMEDLLVDRDLMGTRGL